MLNKEKKIYRKICQLINEIISGHVPMGKSKTEVLELLSRYTDRSISDIIAKEVTVYDLANTIKLSDADVYSLYLKLRKESFDRDVPYRIKNHMPKAVNRDNKEICNDKGGGSNRNKLRYPKKNRSKKTWSNFYKLFPWAAEIDGWDGKTSSRYNPKKK